MRSLLLSQVCVLALGATLAAAADDVSKPEPGKAEVLSDGTKAGQERDDNGLKMQFCWCPPGKFRMGFSKNEQRRVDDESQADVLLTRGFWLAKYEVTQGEFSQLLGKSPWKNQNLVKEGDRFPASYVNWEESTEFCIKLTERERQSGRLPMGWEYALPTEAQWERACRAGSTTAYSFGNNESELGEYAWYHDNAFDAGEAYAHQVGLKKPNSWGLHDMHGNLFEWCRDTSEVQLPGGVDPFVSQPGAYPVLRNYRLLRSGCWHHFPTYCRSGSRCWLTLSDRGNSLGFRVALVPSGK